MASIYRVGTKKFRICIFPVTDVLDWDSWQDSVWSYGDRLRHEIFKSFKNNVLQNFKNYQIPVIALNQDTSKEAVCTVFEKVNTGGKPLDAFELVTAMYAAEGYELRKDWYGDGQRGGRAKRIATAFAAPGEETGVLASVSSTDLLQGVSLFSTRAKREEASDAGKRGKELPSINANRHALLNIPRKDYEHWVDAVERGFVTAAKFLHIAHVYKAQDLPYQSQLIPLAAVLADIGDKWEHIETRRKLLQWYWSGVFGELYGSTTETRIARDFAEVPKWIAGGALPTTVQETVFRPQRLHTMKSRLSAAYKGVNALLMKEGAQDPRSGQQFDHTVFFGENVDIHHIFPKAWCVANGIDAGRIDSIINKTPLSAKTNRIIGGSAPSEYLCRLEEGTKDTPPISPATIDAAQWSHLIDPAFLRNNNFMGFFRDREQRLLRLIQDAAGRPVQQGGEADGEFLDGDEDGDHPQENRGSRYVRLNNVATSEWLPLIPAGRKATPQPAPVSV